MEKIKIKARKEIVQCSKCGKANIFFYLSDFSYGERLVMYDEGRKYAFVNFFEDKNYDEFVELVNEIMVENNKSMEGIFTTELFGVTCDPISQFPIDFVYEKRKCCFCESYDFESNLLEPEKLVDIEVPIVTHKIWENLERIQKRKKIEVMLMNKKII